MRSISTAACTILVAVVLGALGAHALRETLDAHGRSGAWETAVLYHVVHGISLLVTAIWREVDSRPARSRPIKVASDLWFAGILAFSGSLYLLALGAPRWLGPVTPVGGLLFLAGWALLAIGAARLPARTRDTG